MSNTLFTDSHFEFAVIGGGLVGGAIAYGLARLGRNVALFDEGDIALRAARGNFGLVWVQGKGLGLPQYSNWTQLSARRWPELAAMLAADTGVDVALSQPGGFHLCLSELELEHRVRTMRELLAQPGIEPYAYEVVDPDLLARRIPGIGPTVIGATYTALDGHVNSLRLLRALHAGLQQRGGSYRRAQRVESIRHDGNAFAIVANAANSTNAANFRADNVVLAAGLGNAQLAPQLGLKAPVRPLRGQIIVLERAQPFLRHPITTLRQTDEGTVLIGDSQEESGFDDSTGFSVLATLAERAVRCFPALVDVRVTRTWAALRVMSPDGCPIYEQSASAPGAFIVTCHSGVTLAAVHVLELAPQIAAGALPAALACFSSSP